MDWSSVAGVAASVSGAFSLLGSCCIPITMRLPWPRSTPRPWLSPGPCGEQDAQSATKRVVNTSGVAEHLDMA